MLQKKLTDLQERQKTERHNATVQRTLIEDRAAKGRTMLQNELGAAIHQKDRCVEAMAELFERHEKKCTETVAAKERAEMDRNAQIEMREIMTRIQQERTEEVLLLKTREEEREKAAAWTRIQQEQETRLLLTEVHEEHLKFMEAVDQRHAAELSEKQERIEELEWELEAQKEEASLVSQAHHRKLQDVEEFLGFQLMTAQSRIERLEEEAEKAAIIVAGKGHGTELS
ncbi:hypothetical protein HKX48_000792 [Thoreauomyces humboldtii]|nr:hypothetical protein HKX48_000792 [Thoreauomyces humboldtii]